MSFLSNAAGYNDICEQLMVLKGLTRTTGVLHEAQIQQLRMWPHFMFPKLKHELRVNLDTKTIEYSLKFSGKMPAKIQEKLKDLEAGIAWLLGGEWALKVFVGSTAIFKGARKIRSVVATEKKAQAPYISCIDTYMRKDWGVK